MIDDDLLDEIEEEEFPEEKVNLEGLIDPVSRISHILSSRKPDYSFNTLINEGGDISYTSLVYYFGTLTDSKKNRGALAKNCKAGFLELIQPRASKEKSLLESMFQDNPTITLLRDFLRYSEGLKESPGGFEFYDVMTGDITSSIASKKLIETFPIIVSYSHLIRDFSGIVDMINYSQFLERAGIVDAPVNPQEIDSVKELFSATSKIFSAYSNLIGMIGFLEKGDIKEAKKISSNAIFEMFGETRPKQYQSAAALAEFLHQPKLLAQIFDKKVALEELEGDKIFRVRENLEYGEMWSQLLENFYGRSGFKLSRGVFSKSMTKESLREGVSVRVKRNPDFTLREYAGKKSIVQRCSCQTGLILSFDEGGRTEHINHHFESLDEILEVDAEPKNLSEKGYNSLTTQLMLTLTEEELNEFQKAREETESELVVDKLLSNGLELNIVLSKLNSIWPQVEEDKLFS